MEKEPPNDSDHPCLMTGHLKSGLLFRPMLEASFQGVPWSALECPERNPQNLVKLAWKG